MESKVTLSMGYVTPNFTSSTTGKGSQIRRSLRTIGKLINGSEKRNQKPMMETHSTTKCAGSLNDEKSLITNSARTLRRQSLTDISTSGSERSCRSSLGGKPVDTSVNDNRNAKTPPPVCSSTKNNKRWLYFPWSFCFGSKHTDLLKLGYTPTISRRRLSDRLWHSYNA